MKNVRELAERVEDVTGDWHPHPSGADYLVRSVPVPEMRRIRNKYLGKEWIVKHTKRGRETKFNSDNTEAGLVARACVALVDSRPTAGLTGDDAFRGFRVAGDELAAKFCEALGRPVKSGDLVQLHGLWNDRLKELVLGLDADLRDWVIELLDEASRAEAEDELGKDEG